MVPARSHVKKRIKLSQIGKETFQLAKVVRKKKERVEGCVCVSAEWIRAKQSDDCAPFVLAERRTARERLHNP